MSVQLRSYLFGWRPVYEGMKSNPIIQHEGGIPERRSSPLARRSLWLLLGVVLCVHLGVVLASRNGIVRDDASSYVLLGHNLAGGYGYVFTPGDTPTSWRAPGYPVYLASIFWLSGGSLKAAKIMHAFTWVLTALLIYLLGCRLIGERAALLGAGLVGLYPEFVGFTGLLWSENLYIGLFVATLLVLLWAVPDHGPWYAVLLAGGLLGASTLTRSTSVILFPVLGFMALHSTNRMAALWRVVLVCALALVIIGAWAVRNTQLHGRFILVESNAGFNLYVGNNPKTPVPFAFKMLHHIQDDVRYLELTSGRTEGERNVALTRAALEYIKTHPGREIALMIGKLIDFWLPDFFIARNVKSGALGLERANMWLPVLALTAGCFLVCSLAAMRDALRNRHDFATQLIIVTLILYTAPHLLVYGASRYHLPLMPLVLLLAAREITRWREGRRMRLRLAMT